MNRTGVQDPQLSRLTDAIAERVGPQRFAVWFSKSAKFDLRNDSLEINVPNDFISEWIGTHYASSIREAAHEVFGSALPVKFNVVPQLFEAGVNGHAGGATHDDPRSRAIKPAKFEPVHKTIAPPPTAGLDLKPRGIGPSAPALNRNDAPPRPATNGHAVADAPPRNPVTPASAGPVFGDPATGHVAKNRLKHCLGTYVVGSSNQMAYSTANYVCEFPGGQYNPLFVHGLCGLGKTHLLQGLCKRFSELHPTRKWMYLTGEEFTNEYVNAVRTNRVDAFRRRMRDLDLLVIDDVHFMGGKRGTQEEFLHTFNAIEATGKQVVMASDAHPREIEDFSESLVNRFVSGMCVRIDPPNFATRCEILRQMAAKQNVTLSDEVVDWIARRVTQSIRELEGALNRVRAISRLEGVADLVAIRQSLGDLDRHMVAPLRPENILHSVCAYFGLEHKELMSGRRHRTISLARSVAMYLVRKNSKLSFPEIAGKLGKRNHSTVISACRRIEKAVSRNEALAWETHLGQHKEEAQELVQRLEEQARAVSMQA